MHYVERLQFGIRCGEDSRDDGEVLGHVIGDRKRRESAASHEHLFADLDDFEEFGGIRIQIHHVAGFLRRLRAGVHRHGDVGLREGRSVIGTVAGHGNQVPLGLPFPDQCEFALGCGFRQVGVHARLGGDGGSGQRVVSRDHDGFDACTAQVDEPLFDAAFDDVLKLDDAEHLRAFRYY